MIQFLFVLSAGEERCPACLSICQIFALSKRYFSPWLFFRFPLGVYVHFSFKYHVSGERRFLPLFDQFIDKRKSDGYMNFSGKEDHLCSESSMLGVVEGS